jgi:hypothetical protein
MTAAELESVLAFLENTPSRVAALAREGGPAAQTRRPSPSVFSILENVWHLRDIEAEGNVLRIRRLLSEDDPALPDLDGDRLARERRYNERDLAAGIDGFRDARRASLAAVRSAGVQALERRGRLDTVEPVTLAELLLRMAEHDRGHLEQIAALIDTGGNRHGPVA